ncbi:MAG: zinc/iron-chelating domain-containing protein [Desulfobacteraceae bacterium 4572_35.2]|nr:MAG: zinc/iron-chelating domain-containing protein [Desulfobacteraceae bacterium 4572_35.2]
MNIEIVDHYRQLLTQVDTWFSDCLQAHGDKMACREGCSGCCRGLFDITLLDAYLLQQGFRKLSTARQRDVLARVDVRLQQLQWRWPDFHPPFILNHLSHDQWLNMPEDDLTPCPLLDEDGRCLVYDYRPLTCRLHGIPLVDISSRVFCDSYCTLNFVDCDPLELIELRGEFERFFQREVELLSQFSLQLTGRSQVELDTFIPTAILIDFDHLV